MSHLHTTVLRVLSVAALVMLAHAIHAADPDGADGADAPGSATEVSPAPLPGPHGPGAASPIVFEPPNRGIPVKVRLVSGGTRGAMSQPILVSPLSPLSEGLSIGGQPAFYWYVSGATDGEFEFSVKDDERIDPLVEVRLPAPARAGIYGVRLADLGLTLSPGKRYEWSVELMESARHRKSHAYAQSAVVVSPPDAALAARIADAEPRARARLLAARGYWYDAFDTLYVALRDGASSPAMGQDLTALLDQVELEGAGLLGR